MTLDKIAEGIVFNGKIPVGFYLTLTGDEAELAAMYEGITSKHPIYSKIGAALNPLGASIDNYYFELSSSLHNSKITYFAFLNDGGK
jgi:hypothetical protein